MPAGLDNLHVTVYCVGMAEQKPAYRTGHNRTWGWDAANLLALRRRLGLTQQQLAGELGVRQQTVSEWETGAYRPRGASARLLGIVAERAGFEYGTPMAGAPWEDATAE